MRLLYDGTDAASSHPLWTPALQATVTIRRQKTEEAEKYDRKGKG